MKINASVSPSAENGLAEKRNIGIEYDLGEKAAEPLTEAIALYGTKAVYAQFVKGARLPIQQAMRERADVQTDEEGNPIQGAGAFLSDTQVQAYFDNEFKLPADFRVPQTQEQKVTAAWQALPEEVRARLIAEQAAK